MNRPYLRNGIYTMTNFTDKPWCTVHEEETA